MICGNEKTKRILDAAWRAYCYAQSTIDALENIGLSVDGASMMNDSRHDSVSGLYGAMTEASGVIMDICGIPSSTAFFDEACMVLAHATSEMRHEAAFPAKLLEPFMDIADSADKKALCLSPGDRAHEVTMSMCGGVTVYAADPEAAMEKAASLDSDTILEKAAWDSASPTDAYRNP